MEYDMNDTGVN